MAKVLAVVLLFALLLGLMWSFSQALIVREESIADARQLQAKSDAAGRIAKLPIELDFLADLFLLLLAGGVIFGLLFGVPAAVGGVISLIRRAWAWATMPQMIQTPDGAFGAIKAFGVVLTWSAGGIPVAVLRKGGDVQVFPVGEGLAIEGVRAWSAARIAGSAAAAVKSVEGSRAFQAITAQLTEATARIAEARHTVTVKPPPAASTGTQLRLRPNDEASARALRPPEPV